jgi:hypothetical protein
MRPASPFRERAAFVTRDSAPQLKHHAQARGVHPSQISNEMGEGDRTGPIEKFYEYVYVAARHGKINVGQVISEPWAIMRQAEAEKSSEDQLARFDRFVRTEHHLEAEENKLLHLGLTRAATFADYLTAVRREWGCISGILAIGEVLEMRGVDPFAVRRA